MPDPRHDCPEKCTRRALQINSPKISGTGPADGVSIMLVGEAPGQDEDYEGAPFVGISGQVLDRGLKQARIERNEVYITNAVKCATPEENQKPSKSETKLCRGFLVSEIEKIKPVVIGCLGATALEAVLKRSGISKLKNNVFYSEEFKAKVVPIWHPAYILRNPMADGEFVEGLKLIKAEAESKKILQKDTVETKYIDVVNPEQVDKLLKKLEQVDAFVIDLETTSLNQNFAKIICFSFSWKVGLGVTVHVNNINKEQRKRLQKLFVSNKTKVGHNIKFDIQVLRANGFDINGPYFDTMTAMGLINENVREKGLDALVLRYTNMGEYWTELEEFKNKYCKEHKIDKDSFSYKYIPYAILAPYAEKDADATYRLFVKFTKELNRQNLMEFYTKFMLPTMNVLIDMEYRGIKVDMEKLDGLIHDYQKKLEEANAAILQDPDVLRYQKIRKRSAAKKWLTKRADSKTLKTRFPDPNNYIKARVKEKDYIFNPGSPKQLGELFFKVLDITPVKYTDKKSPSTDEESLNIIAQEHDVAICKKILEYRGLQKFLSTYLIGTREMAKKDGRFHPDFFQSRTVTGRLSGNFQQVPREAYDYKDCLIADEGYTFVKADLAQAEFRCWAHYSNDQDMIRDIINGLDIHRKIASEVFGVPEEEVTKEQRTAAKNCVFGLMYGRGTKAIAKQYKISEEQAEYVREIFFSRYPVAAAWLDEVVRFAKENMYVKTWLGRVRRLPEIMSDDRGVRAEAERQAKNSPIQALASDMNNHYMVKNLRTARKYDIECHPVAMVHDANVVAVKDEDVTNMVKIMNKVVKKAFPDFLCPMKLDFEVGKTLGSMKNIEKDK